DLRALRLAPPDVVELGAREDLPRPRIEREDPEPLQLLAVVASQSEDPAAPGAVGADAHAELEGAPVPGEQATPQDEAETVGHQEHQHHADHVEQRVPLRHAASSCRPGRGALRRAETKPPHARSRGPDVRWMLSDAPALEHRPPWRGQAPRSAARTRASAMRTAWSASSSISPAACARSRSWRAFSRSISCDISARSESTEIRLSATERNPPSTAATQVSPSTVVTSTTPGTSTESRGAWPGSTPRSPSVVRAMTLVAWPDHTRRSAA